MRLADPPRILLTVYRVDDEHGCPYSPGRFRVRMENRGMGGFLGGGGGV